MGTPNKTAQVIANADLGALDDMLRAALEAQPWYRKYSNEITTGFFGLLQVLGFIIGTGVELPAWAQISIAGVLLVGNVLGIKKTTNGVTDASADQIVRTVEDYVGRHRSA